jgi:hypothetical protein
MLLLGAVGALICTLIAARLLTQDHKRVSDPTLRAVATDLDGTMRGVLSCGGLAFWGAVILVIIGLGLAGR